MIFDELVREAIIKGLRGLDDIITDENAPKALDIISEYENHKLLDDNRAYIFTKVDGEIKVIYTSNENIGFETEPLEINLQPILDTARDKCYKALGDKAKEYIINDRRYNKTLFLDGNGLLITKK